jgi:hypothetical protein
MFFTFVFYFSSYCTHSSFVGMNADVSMEAKKVARLLRSETSRDDEVLALLSL